MKSYIHKFSNTIIPLIALTLLVVIAADASKKAARYQANAIAQSEAAPQIPASSIAELMNSLASGR